VNVLDLVRPSSKDLGSGQRVARRYLEILTGTQAVANVTLNSSVVGADLVRIVHTLTFTTTPGAAQTLNYWQALLQDASTTVIAVVAGQPNFAHAAAALETLTVSGLELVMMQGDLLNLQANFNAGAAGNTASLHIQGWEFPRGNLQR
jgi:trimethylamine:corrinoid methyltransferase-like protein